MATDPNGDMPTGETDAGDSLAAPPQVGDSANTVTVPADALPGCKVGDTYTVKSVGDGNVVLTMAPSEDSGDDWGEGLKAAAPRGEM